MSVGPAESEPGVAEEVEMTSSDPAVAEAVSTSMFAAMSAVLAVLVVLVVLVEHLSVTQEEAAVVVWPMARRVAAACHPSGRSSEWDVAVLASGQFLALR
jgi:hypothetical protein